jgi:hypothetical protein
MDEFFVIVVIETTAIFIAWCCRLQDNPVECTRRDAELFFEALQPLLMNDISLHGRRTHNKNSQQPQNFICSKSDKLYAYEKSHFSGHKLILKNAVVLMAT